MIKQTQGIGKKVCAIIALVGILMSAIGTFWLSGSTPVNVSPANLNITPSITTSPVTPEPAPAPAPPESTPTPAPSPTPVVTE